VTLLTHARTLLSAQRARACGQVAIKIIDKARLPADGAERLQREVVLVAQLDHPHIVRFYEVIESPTAFYMVFEYAVGGELYDVICQRRFTEPEARGKFFQLMSAMLYCHDRHIVHRDLKVCAPRRGMCARGDTRTETDLDRTHSRKTSCSTRRTMSRLPVQCPLRP
jgi:serine/threonine protein kinase